MRASTPGQRSTQARGAAFASWSRTVDPASRTGPARRAFLDRFEPDDPTLDPAQRTRMAVAARRAYFTSLALKSAQARRKTVDDKHAAGANEVVLHVALGATGAQGLSFTIEDESVLDAVASVLNAPSPRSE